MPKWAVPIWDLEKTSPLITRVFCVSPQFFAPYLWNDLGSNIRVSFFVWCGKSITRAKLKMEIPASKGMRDKKCNQLIRWTTTGFVISNCFWGFCPFVLTKISTQSTWALKCGLGLKNDHSLSFGFGLFLHLRAWKRKGVSEPLLRTTTTFHALRERQLSSASMCFGILVRSHWRWGFLCLTARKNSSSASQSLWEVCCFACQPSNRRTVRIGLSRFFFPWDSRDSKTPGLVHVLPNWWSFHYANAFRGAPGLHAFGIF